MRLVLTLLLAGLAQAQPTDFSIETYAGGDLLGDGGPATGSQLGEPRDVVVAPSGEVFFRTRISTAYAASRRTERSRLLRGLELSGRAVPAGRRYRPSC